MLSGTVISTEYHRIMLVLNYTDLIVLWFEDILRFIHVSCQRVMVASGDERVSLCLLLVDEWLLSLLTLREVC